MKYINVYSDEIHQCLLELKYISVYSNEIHQCLLRYTFYSMLLDLVFYLYARVTIV